MTEKETKELFIKLLKKRTAKSLRGEEEFDENECIMINKLAIEYRKSTFFKETEKQNIEEKKDLSKLSAIEIYRHMLIKIIKAPTTAHLKAAIILLVPMLADKLKEENNDKCKYE